MGVKTFTQYLKRIKVIVMCVKLARRSLASIIRYSMKFLFWRLTSFRNIRQGIFDSAPESRLMLSKGLHENMIISSDDKAIGRELFINKEFDLGKLRSALEILSINNNDSLLIDIGANIGPICIPAVKRGLFNRAIAIEPEPFNYNLLMANIHINSLNEVVVAHNLALGENEGDELTFELSATNYGDHRVRVSDSNGKHGEVTRRCIKVKSEPFDKVIGEVNANNTLIWIDTQGFEGYVLAGARKAISAGVPLVIEFWPYGMLRSRSYTKLKNVLLHSNYHVFYDLDFNKTPTRISNKTLDDVWARLGEEGNYTDLLII